MDRDNSSIQLKNQGHQRKEQSASVHFENEPEKLPESDEWQNQKSKYRRNILAEKDCDNTAAWQINNSEKSSAEMDKDPNGILTIILGIRTICTKYLN